VTWLQIPQYWPWGVLTAQVQPFGLHCRFWSSDAPSALRSTRLSPSIIMGSGMAVALATARIIARARTCLMIIIEGYLEFETLRQGLDGNEVGCKYVDSKSR